MSSSTMVADAAGVAAIVTVEVAVFAAAKAIDATGVAAIVVIEVAIFAATKAVDAIITAVVISVIIRAIVVIAYDSSPFITGFQKLLSVIEASFAAIASCYFEIALV